MTEDQKDVIRKTWVLVSPMARTTAALFYYRLFEIDPPTRLLFQADDMPGQRRKLMQTLDALVQGLDRLDELVPVLEDLGRRHLRYGVRDSHYDSVGAALLWTLECGLGTHWSDEAREAWTAVYALAAGIMQKAARESPSAA